MLSSVATWSRWLLPVADGGDGTLDAAIAAGFERVPVTVVRADR